MRKSLLGSAVALTLIAAIQAHAGETDPRGAAVAACVTEAARLHRLPPSLLVILLQVEGGTLGRISHNANGTVDIGPMQVNQIWLPKLAAHWNAPPAATYLALRDSFCANVEGGAWILRQALDEAHGDLWDGVGRYHSHDPAHKTAYLRQVLEQALRLRDRALKSGS
jgi:hypothetical protein